MWTLQQLSLEYVIKNFPLYHMLYSITKDESQKLHFLFLRKVYSLQIVTKLHQNSAFKPLYMDLLINEYIKELDSSWLDQCFWHTIVAKIAEIGHSLEMVVFHRNNKPWIKLIRHLPNIKSFVYERYCNDNFLHAIAQYCPNIETIDVSRSPVSNKGIKHLCCKRYEEVACSMLKVLVIDQTRVEERGVKYVLKNLPSLENIESNFCLAKILFSLHRHNLDCIEKIKPYNITHLDFLGMKSNVVKICAALCPNLKALVYCVHKTDNFNLLYELPKLEDLYLNVSSLNTEEYSWPPFYSVDEYLKVKGSKLTVLRLCYVSLSWSVLAKYCPNLNSFEITDTAFVANEDDSVPAFLNLQEIYIDQLDLSNSPAFQAMCHLLSSPSMKCLRFKECHTIPSEIKDRILRCCQQCNVISVDFDCCGLEPKFLEDILLTCSSLEILDLNVLYYENGINSKDMEGLESIADRMPNRPTILYTDSGKKSLFNIELVDGWSSEGEEINDSH